MWRWGPWLVVLCVAQALGSALSARVDALNAALRDVVVAIDAQVPEQTVELTSSVKVYVRFPQGVRCSGLGLGDVQFATRWRAPDEFEWDAALTDLRFNCSVALCLRTSLPLNDWECRGSVAVVSSAGAGSRVLVRQRVQLTDGLPALSEPSPTPCEERVFMSGVHFSGRDLKTVLGIDTTPFVITALEGGSKGAAVGPIREAVCDALYGAGRSLGEIVVGNSLVALLRATPRSGSSATRLEESMAESLAGAVVLPSTLVAALLAESGGRRVVVPPWLVRQAGLPPGVPRLVLALLAGVVGTPLPADPGAWPGGGADSDPGALDLLALARLVAPAAAHRLDKEPLRLEVPGAGALEVGVASAALSLSAGLDADADADADAGELVMSLLGSHTVGLPSLQLKRIRVRAELRVRADLAVPLGDANAPVRLSLDDVFVLDVAASDVLGDAALLVALDAAKLGDVQIGPAAEALMNCALAAFRTPPKVARVQLTAASASLRLAGGALNGLGALLRELANSVLPALDGLLARSLTWAARLAEGAELASASSCPVAPAPDAIAGAVGPLGPLYDFTEGPVRALSRLVSAEAVNRVLRAQPMPIEVGTGPRLTLELPRLGGVRPQRLDVSVANLRLGLGPLEDLALLAASPKWRSLLHNRAAAANLSLSFQLRLETAASGDASWQGFNSGLLEPGQRNVLSVEASLGALDGALDVLAALPRATVLAARLAEVPSLDCWVAKLSPGGGEHNVSLALVRPALALRCQSCDSALVRQFVERLGHPHAREQLLALAGRLATRWLALERSRFDTVERWTTTVAHARARCAAGEGAFFQNSLPPPQPVGELESDLSGAYLLLAGLVSLLLSFGALVAALLADEKPRVAAAAAAAAAPERVALWRNPSVPLWLRVSMPALLALDFACFVYGHVGSVIRISVLGTLLGAPVELADLAQFSVVTSTQELWKGGAIALAVLISVFSIAWPYVKLVLLAGCWFAPPQRLRFSARGRLLQLLDVVGKWSCIELFVVAFLLCFLDIPIRGPDQTLEFLPADLVTFHLAVLPQTNLYTFIAALLLSIALGSAAAAYHEAIADAALLRRMPAGAAAAPLACALLGSAAAAEPARVRALHYLALAAVLAAFLAHLVACSLKVLHVEILGLVGRAMSLGGSLAVNEYSLLSFIARALAPGSPTGQRSLALVIFCIVFVAPLAQLAQLARLALPGRRITLRTALRMRVVNQLLCAFAALEVFLLGVGVSVLELGMLTRTLLSEQCNGATAFIQNVLLPMDLVSVRDAQAGCFALDAKLLPSVRVFLLAVFLANAANIVLGRYALDKMIAMASSTTYDAEVGDALQGTTDGDGDGDGTRTATAAASLLDHDDRHAADEAWLVLDGRGPDAAPLLAATDADQLLQLYHHPDALIELTRRPD